MNQRLARLRRRQYGIYAAVILLLTVHAGMLAYSATRHSPTALEPAFLVAGLSHWEFARFELFRVNPPLVRMVAALPVKIAGYNEDWSRFDDSPGGRPEFQMGADFITANGERSVWLFTIARWACAPFSVAGALFCFLWSRELWQSNLAGLISLVLWAFDPNILAHGELITTDCAAASLGLGACYLFWRWLNRPSWPNAAYAGLLLGLAELTKTSWLILFILWPHFALFWLAASSRGCRDRRPIDAVFCSTFLLQCGLMVALGLDVLNLGYGFDGTFTPLGDFTFVSKAMTGLPKAGEPGNRFSNSPLGRLPVPLPRQYLRGIDLQKKDLEDHPVRSYLRGEWKHGGWWYYYIYGTAVKTPHGSQLILLIAVLTVAGLGVRGRQTPLNVRARRRDLVVLLAPPLAIFALVSSQLEFNQHLRYVLPAFGFALVLSGAAASWLHPNPVRSSDTRPLPWS